MDQNQNIHHRHSIRLKEYDYTKQGAYFITICTHNRANLFGNISGDFTGEGRPTSEGRPTGSPLQGVILNEYGEIAMNEWLKTEIIRKNIHLGEFVIMSNHMHGIIFITDLIGSKGGGDPPTKGDPPGRPYGGIRLGR